MLAACDRGGPGHVAPPLALAVRVGSDTSRAQRLETTPPRARVWLRRVSPARPPALDLAPPEAAPSAPVAEPPEEPAPPGLEVSEDLKPPILRAADALAVPERAPRASVELDVRVDEDGAVSDALWAEGSRDSALVEAATACALSMRFYPALRSGRPVAVWCRQRFDFAGR